MAEINEEPTVCTRWRKRAILAGFVSGFFLVLAGTVLLSAFFLFCQLETDLVNRVTRFTVADRQTYLICGAVLLFQECL